MRCHNLAGAAASGLRNSWNYLTAPRGNMFTQCSFDSKPSILHQASLLVFLVGLLISFNYRNMRLKPRLSTFASLSRFPYEPTILLLYASTLWLRKTGSSVLTAFLHAETRAEMWEGMDIFGGDGSHTIFMICYFVFLELLEINVSLNLLMKKYLAFKNGAVLLPVTEEKEVLLQEREVTLQSIDEKEVSIYEAIASTPAPVELEAEPLITDSESGTTPPTRPSLWQRVKTRFSAIPQGEISAEGVAGRYYMLAFLKSNLLFCFAIVANEVTCSLTPAQYFDNKASNFMLLLATLVLWNVRSAWIIVQGFTFAKAELKDRRSAAL